MNGVTGTGGVCFKAESPAWLRARQGLDTGEASEPGKFAWVLDPEGHKVERRQRLAGQ